MAEKKNECMPTCVCAHVCTYSKAARVRARARYGRKELIFLNAADLVLQTASANNAWSAQQAQKQMDFQERLSNTAHQRQVADLKAAGLNPVLSAKFGGASTPSGSMGDTDTSVTSALLQALGDVASGAASGAAYGSYRASSAKKTDGVSTTIEDIMHVAADALPYRWRKSAHGAIDLVFAQPNSASFVDAALGKPQVAAVKNWFKSLPKPSSESSLVKGSSSKGSSSKSKPLVTRTAGR